MKGGHDPLINGVLRDNVMDDHSCVFLPLPPEPGVGLLVKLQRPGQPEPDQGGTAGLQVQPMAGGRRVDDRHRDLALVPIGDIPAGLDLPDGEPLPDALQVVLEPE